MARRVENDVASLEQNWCRELFLGFSRWPHLPWGKGDLARRFGAYNAFFVDLDNSFSSRSEISQVSLLRTFGAETLRRRSVVVRYLRETLRLEWNRASAIAVTEEQRAMNALAGTDARRCEVLMKYANHLENRHGRSAVLSHRTQRIYRQVATHFLEASQTSDTESLTQNQVTSFLKENAGSRNSLGPFLTFLGGHARGLTLSPPVTGVTRDGVGRAQTVAALVTALRGRLSKARHRALIAELLRILYGLSRSEVLAMGVADVALRGNQAWVLIREDWLEVPAPVARLVASYHATVVERGGDKLFPGRGPAGVLDPTSVAFHLRGLSRA